LLELFCFSDSHGGGKFVLLELRQAMAANAQPLAIVPQYSNLSFKLSKASADAPLLDVLPYLGRMLGLQGLACLAASSQQLKHACLQFV
jgi:hypothetical protein